MLEYTCRCEHLTDQVRVGEMNLIKIFIKASMAIVLFSCSGCLSINGIMNDEEKLVYIGVRTDAKAISYLGKNEPGWGLMGLIDLPLSLVMDTVLLPYTIPHDLSDTKKQPDQTTKTDKK